MQQNKGNGSSGFKRSVYENVTFGDRFEGSMKVIQIYRNSIPTRGNSRGKGPEMRRIWGSLGDKKKKKTNKSRCLEQREYRESGKRWNPRKCYAPNYARSYGPW